MIGDLLFTLFRIISPMGHFFFLISVVIGFFGIYIPWNEKRKKNGGKILAARERSGTPTPVNRATALARMVRCIPLFVTGMTMLIASAVMGIPVLIALGGGLTIFSLLRMERAGKDFRAGRISRPAKTTKLSKPAFRSDTPDHEHITVSGQGSKGRLEQLDTLKSAGLITDQEYRQKRQEILNGL